MQKDLSLYGELRRGDRLSSDLMNGIVRSIISPKEHNAGGYDKQVKNEILCVATTAIPSYSIFPIKFSDKSSNSLEACIPVEKYNDSHSNDYLTGYWVTNGAYPIMANGRFYGHVIDERSDFPVKLLLDSSASNTNICGFKSGQWEAQQGAEGLYITGKCPFGTNIYFVRKAGVASAKDCVIAKVNSGDSSSGYAVTLYGNGINEAATGSGTMFVTELAMSTTIPANSYVIAHPTTIVETGGNE